jgi:hypothetical protein
MNKKTKVSCSIFLLLVTQQIALGQHTFWGGNGRFDEYSSNVPQSTALYQGMVYTFNVANIVNIRRMTAHFTDQAYINAGTTLANAIHGLSFQLAPLQTFGGNYDSTVIFVEMDTGENLFDAVAIGFNNNLQNCTTYNSLRLDPTGQFLQEITFGSGGARLSGFCDNQRINRGLIVFNTNNWNAMFSPNGTRDPARFGATRVNANANKVGVPPLWLPPLAEQQHWITHEMTHLLGLGHIITLGLHGICESVMIKGLIQTQYTIGGTVDCNTSPAPLNYTNEDIDLLRQLGYQ